MFDVAISQKTTPRWEFGRELDRLSAHGFTSLGMWRPKLPDAGVAAAAAALAGAGMRASSLQWAGGFTGSDGRSFAESVADAIEAVEAAAMLGTAAPASRPPVLVLHSGCRGGHTRSHATRLLQDALAALAVVARREGVGLALEPVHTAVAPDCSFLATLADALDVVAACGDPAVGISLDLWQFADDPGLETLLPRLASTAALVRVADRCDPPAFHADRLPACRGDLPLEQVVTTLVHLGYGGDVEFDPVGETVEGLGYDGVLGEMRLVADAWRSRITADGCEGHPTRAEAGEADVAAGAAAWCGQSRRAAGAGARRSQASSQAVSRG